MNAVTRVAAVLATILIGGAACANNDEGEPSVSEAVECPAVAQLIPEFLDGLRTKTIPADPDQPTGSVNCLWYGEARSVSIGQEPRTTSEEEMARIRDGQVYTGDTPPYKTVENDRVKALNAVAVLRADSDTVDEPGSMATIHLYTPGLRVTVAGWTADAVLEIATRIAERATRD